MRILLNSTPKLVTAVLLASELASAQSSSPPDTAPAEATATGVDAETAAPPAADGSGTALSPDVNGSGSTAPAETAPNGAVPNSAEQTNLAPEQGALPASVRPAANSSASEPVAEAGADTASDTAPAPAWTDNLTLGGGLIVYYSQPVKTGKGDVSVFFANLLLDGQWDNVGLHVEPRFRDTRLRPFFDGPAWLQEAYASLKTGPVTTKLGKVYKRSSGLFWDNSFYGNVQVYDGLKLDPNYGISVEGSVGEDVGVDFAVQYFVVDGRTNVSLQGRDTISIAGARRRHTLAGRVEPWFKVAAAGEVRVGVSAEHFTADIPDAKDGVARLAGDAKFTYKFGEPGTLGLWGEFVHQSGRHVVDHPAAGAASDSNNYFLVGAEYALGPFTLRYNLSHADYTEVDTSEILHVPGLGYRVDKHIDLLAEYVVWRQSTPTDDIDYDTSVNVTLHGHF